MKGDIPVRKVEDLAIALVPRNDDIHDDLWDVYIINLKDQPIKCVLVNSKGYGEIDGNSKRTTTFRHYYEEISAHTAEPVEAVIKKVFQLTNEFWVSFSFDNYLFDKKYVFVRGIQDESLFTDIPVIGRRGIMIK